MLLPAAMFSMFFFLSLFVQNVMGYSPIKAGVAKLVAEEYAKALQVLEEDPEVFAVTETFPTGEAYGMAVTLENTNLGDALDALGAPRLSPRLAS